MHESPRPTLSRGLLQDRTRESREEAYCEVSEVTWTKIEHLHPIVEEPGTEAHSVVAVEEKV